jgi:two-component system chemotaxis response regulator CheB
MVVFEKSPEIRNLIVIGASAGGINAIQKVISGFSDQWDMAVVIVLHVPRRSNPDILISGFQRHTELHCQIAFDGAQLVRGNLYLAPPDHQLMVKNNTLLLTQGPHENRYRPSIDVLFRSAAVNYGHRSIGIILTGLLEDGTSGMSAIHRSGGICIIQDPREAEFSDMPSSVMHHIAVDYLDELENIPSIVRQLVESPLPPQKEIPSDLQVEAHITEKMMSHIDQLKEIADRSDFVCPDCGGGLWALKDDPNHRYRCHTGHV